MLTDKKTILINLGIIVGVVLIGLLIIYIKSCSGSDCSKDTVKCIGAHSTLYTQKGCHYCKIQEDKFGENKEFLDIVDCFYEEETCEGITATPSWVINGTLYKGVYEIEELKNMTGCS